MKIIIIKIFFWITFYILFFIIIIAKIVFIQLIKKRVISLPRKKRTNELDDNFIYEDKNKNVINNSINFNDDIINND